MRKAVILTITGLALLAASAWLIIAGDQATPASPGEKSPMPTAKEQQPAGQVPVLAMGSETAPLTIDEYGDFQCPRCNTFFTLVEPQIRRDYVDTGKVRLVWHNFAIIGQESKVAAQGAYCAADQRLFPQYYDTVFNHMNDNYWSKGINGENVGALSAARVKELAGRTSELINQGEFDACLDNGKYAQTVDQELAQAQSQGYSLNTYVVGEEVVTGVQPYSIFRTVIESQLR